ncbi:MAG: hypothetical protein LBO05_06745, partial [Deltaproteobacteria bacterium]|nr:hypothetical protein [Deltaproteobacteria bacterium]
MRKTPTGVVADAVLTAALPTAAVLLLVLSPLCFPSTASGASDGPGEAGGGGSEAGGAAPGRDASGKGRSPRDAGGARALGPRGDGGRLWRRTPGDGLASDVGP